MRKIYKYGNLEAMWEIKGVSLHQKKDFLVGSLEINRTVQVVIFLLISLAFHQSSGQGKEYILQDALIGNVDAQLFLGNHFRTGPNKDFSKSIYWMMQAAKSANPLACRFLGRAYWLGKEVPKNIEKAVYWLLRGAKLNDVFSLESLSMLREEENRNLRAYSCMRLAGAWSQNDEFIMEIERLYKVLTEEEKELISSDFDLLKKQINQVQAMEPVRRTKELKRIKSLTLPTGEQYTGELVDDQPHGYGRKTLRNETIYLGNFTNGRENGYGTLFNQKGIIIFEGIWKNSVPVVSK